MIIILYLLLSGLRILPFSWGLLFVAFGFEIAEYSVYRQIFAQDLLDTVEKRYGKPLK